VKVELLIRVTAMLAMLGEMDPEHGRRA